jgi:hypothetical protein
MPNRSKPFDRDNADEPNFTKIGDNARFYGFLFTHLLAKITCCFSCKASFVVGCGQRSSGNPGGQPGHGGCQSRQRQLKTSPAIWFNEKKQ